MRLTSLGKIVLLILAVGVAVGGWRMWQNQRPNTPGTGGAGAGSKGSGGIKLPGIKIPGFGGSGSGDKGNGGGGNGSGSNAGAGKDEIQFIITAAKKDWVGEQVERFNAEHTGQWRITTTPVPSREAMHSILSGQKKPVLWSPGSPIWPTRLAEAWSAKSGGTILDMNDPNAYRVFLRSPLVFLTTTRKAKFLRPLLGGPKPWQALRRLSLGQQKTPWGSFRFSHADPLTSSSGMLTLGLILFDYGQQTGQSGALDRLATDKRFIGYLKELERGLVYDRPAEEGTTKLTKAFLEDTSRYDVITAYESAALEAAPKDPNIAVIYPNPTAVSEHAVSLLNAAWITPQQREGAIAFLSFLGSKQALQSGLKYHFRPAQSSSTLSLTGELSRHGAQGFQQTFAAVELPPYEALNAAAYQWRIHIAKKPPT